MKFKVGERYKVNNSILEDDGNIIEITNINGICRSYKFVEGENVNTLDAFCIGSLFADSLNLLKTCSQKIVITSDGETTTAKLYDGKKIVKTAVAKCSPEDEFNFETGAVIAFNRLAVKANESEEKLLNTKFCVVEGDDTFKTGHIYEVVDGKILVPHDNQKYPIESSLHSKQELLDYFATYIATYIKRVGKESWNTGGVKIVEVVND